MFKVGIRSGLAQVADRLERNHNVTIKNVREIIAGLVICGKMDLQTSTKGLLIALVDGGVPMNISLGQLHVHVP